MKRRKFMSLLGGVVAAPFSARAQPTKKSRIGYLSPASAGDPGHSLFRQDLRQLGYVEDKNVTLLERFADGNDSRLPILAGELVHDQVDVIVAVSPPSIRAARDATRSVPIVMIAGDDPVRSGLVVSLARPGGNITGVTILVVDLFGKQMELLKQLVPNIKQAAILWDPAMPSTTQDLMDVRAAATLLGLKLKIIEARGMPGDYEGAFGAMLAEQAEALLVTRSPTFIRDRSRIVNLAAKHQMPAIYSTRDEVRAGGLVSYGSEPAEAIRLIVGYVDRILKGAKPSDLPVEQPTQFELAINLKTARLLGITIPPEILVRASELIE